jgi:hypothetical protein
MPEYILDTRDGPAPWRDLDAFTQGYIEAMFFTSTGHEDDLEDATFAELHPQSLADIIADCKAFQDANRSLLDAAVEHGGDRGEYDLAAAGRDYWYTRNGHGVGFWDRGLGSIGDSLSSAARYSSVDVVRGDDGKVHVC